MSRFPSMRDYATVTVVAARDTGYCNSSEIDVGKTVKQRFSFWRFSSWGFPASNNAVNGVAPAIEPSISRFPSLGSHSFLLRLGDRRQYTPPTQPTHPPFKPTTSTPRINTNVHADNTNDLTVGLADK